MKKKIFLIGPTPGVASEYEICATELRNMGYAVVNPFDFIDTNLADYQVDQYLRKCTMEMCKCDKVVTLMGWDQYVQSAALVILARKLMFDVESIIKYMRPNAQTING